MAPSPEQWKAALTLMISTLLLWKPMFVVIFPGFVYTSDLTAVFLHDGCIGSSLQTVLIFCLLEVLIACVLLKEHVVPMLFGKARWEQFDHSKQRKLVGFVIKILVRTSCALQVLLLISPYVDLQLGLFGKFNVKAANQRLEQNMTLTTCAEAGMSLQDAVALRAWTFTRDNMMAVMVWELAFIPELPADAWLHHLFVILGVALGSDPQLLGSRSRMQPFIDNVGFSLVLGAAFAAGVEASVLMYHLSASNASMQARWMLISIAVQATLVLVFFVGLPLAIVFLNMHVFGSLALGVIVLIIFLAAVEVKMITVKVAIVKHARRKAMSQSTGTAQVSRESGSCFHHDMQKEIHECLCQSQSAEKASPYDQNEESRAVELRTALATESG